MARPQEIERPEIERPKIERAAELTAFTLPAQESLQIGSYA